MGGTRRVSGLGRGEGPRRGSLRGLYAQAKAVLAGDPTDPQGMVALVEAYLAWLPTVNFSPETVRARRMYLWYCLGWAAERGLTRPAEVTPAVLVRYQRWLYLYRQAGGQALSFRSQNLRLVAVRMWFKWLARHHYVAYNPAAELELPRPETRLPKAILSAAEAERILASPDVATPLGLRDRAILEVLYSTGIRRSEATALQVFDVDLDRQTVMVRQGKGRKDRLIPIGARALAWVGKYLDTVRPTLCVPPDGGWLFLTNAGDRFTPQRFGSLVRDYVAAAGIGKVGACHLFRHTMASLMLENGADVRYIQAMLGHASLETTQLYTQVTIRKLQTVHAATHPAANLRPDREAVTDPADDAP